MSTPTLAPLPSTPDLRGKLPGTSAAVLLACGLAVAGAIVYGISLQWGGLAMSVSLQNMATLLAPVAFAAAVVERGVEILISPWRDAGASKLTNEIAAIKARAASDPLTAQVNLQDLTAKSNELEEYRGTTQRYAFFISLSLSTLVSIAGVRAIQPFLAAGAFTAAKPNQQGFFYCVDIALTAVLLAGGADGVHSVVNAVTTFFDSTANKSSQS